MRFPIVALALALALVGCGGGDSPPPPPPPSSQAIVLTMDAASWKFQYSPNMPVSPNPDPEGFSFEFPNENGVHYLSQNTNGKLGTVTASFRVESTAGAQLQEVEPCGGENRPAVRIMFQRIGDTLAAGTVQQPTVYADYRWWGVESYDLRDDGPGALSFTADPNRWSNVFGQNGADRVSQWVAAANSVGSIALTFGGCFAGHGVFKSTPGFVRFTVHSITAQ